MSAMPQDPAGAAAQPIHGVSRSSRPAASSRPSAVSSAWTAPTSSSIPGEVLAVIGDNGAGKSTLIKCLSGAMVADAGEIRLEGQPVSLPPAQDARAAGIETVYQTLAVAPALDIASNMFLGRELRRPGPLGWVLRMLDHGRMRALARQQLRDLGIGTLQNMTQAVETLSGGQRQAVAVARAAAFGSKVDHPRRADGRARRPGDGPGPEAHP